MDNIQSYIEAVKKLCRSIETDYDLCEFVRAMARSIFNETEDHAKAIKEVVNAKNEGMGQLIKKCHQKDREIERLKGGWINVNDRLPETNQEIHVFCGNGDQQIGRYKGVSSIYKKVPHFIFDGIIPIYFTHWRPLPSEPGDG